MSSTSQAVATSARQEAYHGNYYIAGPPQADGSLRWLKRKETNVLYVWPEQKAFAVRPPGGVPEAVQEQWVKTPVRGAPQGPLYASLYRGNGVVVFYNHFASRALTMFLFVIDTREMAEKAHASLLAIGAIDAVPPGITFSAGSVFVTQTTSQQTQVMGSQGYGVANAGSQYALAPPRPVSAPAGPSERLGGPLPPFPGRAPYGAAVAAPLPPPSSAERPSSSSGLVTRVMPGSRVGGMSQQAAPLPPVPEAQPISQQQQRRYAAAAVPGLAAYRTDDDDLSAGDDEPFGYSGGGAGAGFTLSQIGAGGSSSQRHEPPALLPSSQPVRGELAGRVSTDIAAANAALLSSQIPAPAPVPALPAEAPAWLTAPLTAVTAAMDAQKAQLQTLAAEVRAAVETAAQEKAARQRAEAEAKAAGEAAAAAEARASAEAAARLAAEAAAAAAATAAAAAKAAASPVAPTPAADANVAASAPPAVSPGASTSAQPAAAVAAGSPASEPVDLLALAQQVSSLRASLISGTGASSSSASFTTATDALAAAYLELVGDGAGFKELVGAVKRLLRIEGAGGEEEAEAGAAAAVPIAAPPATVTRPASTAVPRPGGDGTTDVAAAKGKSKAAPAKGAATTASVPPKTTTKAPAAPAAVPAVAVPAPKTNNTPAAPKSAAAKAAAAAAVPTTAATASSRRRMSSVIESTQTQQSVEDVDDSGDVSSGGLAPVARRLGFPATDGKAPPMTGKRRAEAPAEESYEESAADLVLVPVRASKRTRRK